jgi:hypothetical protein
VMAFVSMVVANTSRVHPDSGVPIVECCELVGGDINDRIPWGECPNYGALGVTALPYPPSEDGTQFAELTVVPGVGGHVGVIVGGRDHRAASVYGELAEGETALHSTGPDFDSRVLCKDQLWSAIVGNDTSITVDRKNEKIVIAGFGHVWEMSAAQGLVMAEKGGAMISMKDGTIWIKASSILLGETPTVPVGSCLLSPTATPSLSILVPAA